MTFNFSFNKLQLFPFLLAVFAFSLPFRQLQVVLIALLVISWLIEGNLKEKWQSFTRSKAAILFVVFYLLHLIWFFNTTNLEYAIKDIQTKASLLIFPILFAHAIQRESLFFKKISKAFIIGNIFASFCCIIYATYNCINGDDCNFTYTAFSIFMHPTYFSILISIAFILTIFQFNYLSSQFSKYVIIATLLLFIVMIFLLLSKMGIITFVVLSLWMLLIYAVQTKKVKIALIFFFTLVIISLASILLIPQINDRFKAIVRLENRQNIDITTTESTAVRKLIWENAIEIIKENIYLGSGTGDVKDELLESYKNRGMTGAYENKLNAHNQYFQSFITFGIIGIVYFLVLFLYLIQQSLRHKNFIYLSFFIVIALNFIAESALETEAGAISIAFLNSFLFFKPKE